MKVVLDTNVLISGTLWDNSVSHKLIINLVEESAEIFSSLEILEEYKEAVMRDFEYSEEEVDEILEKLISFMKIVNPCIKVNEIKEDSDDNKILECAVESQAEYILSYDNHLLKLKEFREIKIITPEEFLILPRV